MDAFVTRSRPDSPKAGAKCGLKTLAQDRQHQFPKETFEAGGKLFCKSCNLVLDHTRRSSVTSHFTSAKHQKRKAESEEQPPKRQRVLTTMTTAPNTIASEARNELCMEWVAMFAAANIPLSKSDHPSVREFLLKRVVNGGSIPHAKQMQECYLQREAASRKEEVAELVRGKPVSIMTDEMTDDNGKFVLNILAAPLQPQNGKIKTFLLDTVFLDTTNHSTVAQAVVNCVGQFGISFNDIMIINTDNAAYMKKAYKAVLGLYSQTVCILHAWHTL